MVEVNVRYEIYYLNRFQWTFYYASHDLEEVFELMKKIYEDDEKSRLRIDANKVTKAFINNSSDLSWFQKKYLEKNKIDLFKYDYLTTYDNYFDDDDPKTFTKRNMYM